MYERWAGERLVLEKAIHRYRMEGCLISVYFGPLLRTLHGLPGCVGGFMLCCIGATHCCQRHVGLERQWRTSLIRASSGLA